MQGVHDRRRGDRRLLAGVGAFLAGLCVAAGGCAADGPPDVLLISIDTLRADRLGCYGHTGARTPNLDRLAADGTRYEQVTSPAPLTLPSHATLLTGLIPPRHGVRDNFGYSLPDSVETLAEALRRHGYQTAAFVSGVPLSRDGGLDQGFDHYDDALPGGALNRGLGSRRRERYAADTLDAALAWMRRAEPDRPAFVFLHLFDPHSPYEKPLPGEPAGSYDGEVAYVDRELGRFLAALEQEPRWDGRVTIVTADHGEGLGEHRESTHALFVYESTQRVPLIVHGLRGRRPPHVARPVGLVDVAPTVLAIAGAPPPADADGGSLLDAPGAAPRDLYFETMFPELRFGWAPLRGVRRGNLKWIEAPRPELYDLTDDPGETRNLAAARPRQAAALAGALEGIAAAAAEASVPVDPARRRALESLGYVSAPPAEAGSGVARPDPKDRVEVYEGFQAAMQAIFAGELPDALARFARIEEDLRDSPVFYERWGDAASRVRDLGLAIRCYRRSLELQPAGETVRLNLGVALYLTGAMEPALAEFLELLRRDAEHPEAHLYAGIILGQHRKDAPEALRHLREFVRLAPDHPQAAMARRVIATQEAAGEGRGR